MKKMFEELSKLKISNPERFKNSFNLIAQDIQDGTFDIEQERIDKENDHYIVVEKNRLNSYFIHIVPKEAYNLFSKIREEFPEEFLGFTVLIKKHHGKDVRLSCFGIPCTLLIGFLSKK